MNSENFGGSYNGYGFNSDGTEKERNDLTAEDFGRNESFGHSALDSYRKEEIAEEVEEQGYEETVREDLNHLFAELDKQPHNAKILGYIESTKAILERLEKEVSTDEVKTEPLARIEEKAAKPENVQAEPLARIEEKPRLTTYVDSQGRTWFTRQDAIESDHPNR